MKKKIKIIVITLLIVLAIALITIITLNQISNNGKELKTKESLITKQEKIEKKFKTEGYTINKPNVILNPYGNSPLTALIMFETKNKVSPKVTIKGKSEKTTFTYTAEKSKKHYLNIYGLYPDKENTIIIEYGKTKKEIKIKTNKLPDDFVTVKDVYKDEDKLTNDLYFFTPSSKGYTCAYDINGDVRWYLTNEALWQNTRLKNGHLLLSTERLINTPYYMTGLYEMDLMGKIYAEYSLKGGYHHDYYEMENGNLLIASDDFNNEYGTVEDYIVELDRKTGKIVKKIDLKKILNMEDGKSENWSEYDWFHNNSVWYDKKTNSITLSGRHQDAVINIDYTSGKLNWILGDSTNWSKKYQKYFLKKGNKKTEFQWSQHAAMITKEGYLFLFDNGNNKSKNKEEYTPAENSYSRGVMYKINTKNMTATQIWQYGKERGSKFYSPYISDVDYIEKNHYIIHSGGISYKDGKIQNQPAGIAGSDELLSDTVELINDKKVFELKLNTNNYRVEKMSLYTKADKKRTFKKAKKLGTLGQTEYNDKRNGFILSAKQIDKNYKKHKIKLTKEEDRLVLEGTFKKGANVNILLYKNMTSLVYNVRVSKHPYTALCVDVFTEKETKEGITINKYINSEGLKGKYTIYIEINNKIYKTNKTVKF